MQCKLSVACSYCLVSLFSYCSNKSEQQKCRKRAGVYTGIIVLGRKRSCDTSFCFSVNTGVGMEFPSKRCMVTSNFLLL